MPNLKNHLQQAWQEQVKKSSEDFEKKNNTAATDALEADSNEPAGEKEVRDEIARKRKVGETSSPEDETTRKK